MLNRIKICLNLADVGKKQGGLGSHFQYVSCLAALILFTPSSILLAKTPIFLPKTVYLPILSTQAEPANQKGAGYKVWIPGK
jgi:hypothetical protein